MFVCPAAEIDPGSVMSARKTACRQDKRTVTGKAARESAGMGAGYSIPDPGQGGKPVPDEDVPRSVVIRGQCRWATVGRTVQAEMGRCRTAGVWYKGVAPIASPTRGCLGREQDGKVGDLVGAVGIAVGGREIVVPEVRGSPRRNAGDVSDTRRTRLGSLDVKFQVRWVVRWEGRLFCP